MNTNVTTCQPVYRLKSEANQYGSITMIASGWADAFSHWQWESEEFPTASNSAGTATHKEIA